MLMASYLSWEAPGPSHWQANCWAVRLRPFLQSNQKRSCSVLLLMSFLASEPVHSITATASRALLLDPEHSH